MNDSSHLRKSIGIASIIMMASVFLSRVLGQVRQSYIAYVGGVGPDVDAYNIAFQIPELINHIVAGGYLSVTFIPLFSIYLEQNREEEGWRSFSNILTVFTVVLAFLSIGGIAAAPTLVSWLAPGSTANPEVFAKAVSMTRIIIPGQIAFFAGGLLMAVQYAKGQFLIPALAPLIYNLGIIIGGLALADSIGIEGFAWGVLLGAFGGQVLVQWFGATRIGLTFRPHFSFSHPDIRRFVWLAIPLVVGLSMTFSMEFFLRFFGSMLPPGTVSTLNYALRVQLLLVAIFGQAAGTASFPYLARLFAQGEHLKMRDMLDDTVCRYVGLVIPASVLMAILAPEIVLILFQRGAFSASDTVATAQALRILLVSAFAMAMVSLVVRGFYAMKNTWLPALFGTIAVVLSLPVYWAAARYWGGQGIAVALSLSAIAQALILYTVWYRVVGKGSWRTVQTLTKALGLSLPLAIISWGMKALTQDSIASMPLLNALVTCTAVTIVWSVALLILARLTKFAEIDDVTAQIAKKLHIPYREKK